MTKNMFLLLNKHDNSMIDEFYSKDFYPKQEIENAINHYWFEQEIKEVQINHYASDNSRMTDGKVVLSKDVVEFYLIQLTDIN